MKHLYLATFSIGILMALFGYFYTQTSQAACYWCLIRYYDVFCTGGAYADGSDSAGKCPFGNDGGNYKHGSSSSNACGYNNQEVIDPPDWGQCIGNPCQPVSQMAISDASYDKCPGPTGLTQSCTAADGIKLKWNEIPGTSQYNVRIDMEPFGHLTPANGDAIIDNHNYLYYITSGTGGKNYKWWVHGNSGGTEGAVSEVKDFSCPAACTSSISAPGGLTPDSNVAQGTTSVNLSWSSVSGANRYLLRFRDNTADATKTTCGGSVTCWDINHPTTSQSVSVSPDRSYTWWVHAVKNAAGSCSEVTSSQATANFSVPTNLQTPTITCELDNSTSNKTVTTGTDVTWSTTIRPTGTYTHSWSGTALDSSNPGNVSSFTKSYSTTDSRTASVTVSRTGYATTTATCPTVTVNEPFNYSFNTPNNITVTQGSSGSTTITLTKDAGTAQSVSLSSGSPIPAGASKGSSPNPGSCSPNNTCNSTFTISTSSPTSTTPTPVGTYPITVTGSTAGLSNKTTSFNLIVQAATGGPIPIVNIRANNSEGPISIAHNTAATLSWTTTNCTVANNCTCTASGTWCPAGNCPKSISGSTEGTGSKTGPNSYSYTLTCSNANGSNSDTVTVNVAAAPGVPSCSLSASPSSGIGSFPSTITVTYANLTSSPESITVDCGTGDNAIASSCNGRTGSCTATCTYPAVSSTATYNATASIGSVTCSPRSITDNPPGTPPPSNTCPWIQTTGSGGVHSNTGINTSCSI